MSGIVGILNLDGAPVDRTLLRRMTDFMTFRGPDEQRIWMDGNVGFGHTLLRTTFESEHEHQPFTLDGKLWIVADARVDAQTDLIAKLNARGEHVEPGATDVELLLRAYRTWGEDCVDHVLGDFAFAVWDGDRQRLFCARDHLGVKPFFYARVGQALIFSNTLDCIREHSAVSDKLNDLAIADFLLFDMNQDPATTSFADIQRIPPAHRATWSGGGMHINRYWTLPIDEPIFFKRADDYTDRFRELLDAAVSDRLRTNKVAVLMSGGLDSTTIAATACKILRRRTSDADVRAYTTVMTGIDRNERFYAGLVAEHLKIPIQFLDRGPRIIDRDWNDIQIHTPQPVLDPTALTLWREQFRSVATFTRVLLYGEGPDSALKYEWKPYFSYLSRKRMFRRLAGDVCEHIIRHRRIPLLSTVPHLVKQWIKGDPWQLSFPGWFNEDFERRVGLRTRWVEPSSGLSSSHPLRPIGYRDLCLPNWQVCFEMVEAGERAVPIETRVPFMDLRLLRYMLAVPAIPWCRTKHIQRRAMQGALPSAVLRRRKSPLRNDPAWVGVRHTGLPPLEPARGLCDYIRCERVPRHAGDDMLSFRVNFRPYALNYWLQNLRHRSHNFKKEESENGFIKERAG